MAKTARPKKQVEQKIALPQLMKEFAQRINTGKDALRTLAESHHIIMSEIFGSESHTETFDVCTNLTCSHYRELSKNL